MPLRGSEGSSEFFEIWLENSAASDFYVCRSETARNNDGSIRLAVIRNRCGILAVARIRDRCYFSVDQPLKLRHRNLARQIGKQMQIPRTLGGAEQAVQ